MNNRDSFIFYRTFYDCIKELSQKSAARLYEAIFGYIFDGIEPKLEGIEKGIFSMIKAQLDANNKRYENGKKGGRPPKNGSADSSKDNEKRTEGFLKNKNQRFSKDFSKNKNQRFSKKDDEKNLMSMSMKM